MRSKQKEMTNMYNKHDDYDWANEYIVLYESADELIVLHRNIMRNEEFILLSGQSSADSSTEAKYLLDFVEYELLIPHKFKIRGYHKICYRFDSSNLRFHCNF